MRQLLRLSLFILLIANINASAQSFSPKRLDSLFTAMERTEHSAGSVYITRAGKVIYSRAFGQYFDNKVWVKNSIDTRFRIGSITKVFTAVMVLQLAQQHKLALNTPVSKYFPQLLYADKITVDMLLSHSSGLHDFTTQADYNTYSLKPATRADMLARLARYRPDFKPGEKTFYSSTNYLLLGYIIEQVTGKSYAVNLQQRIIAKSNLKHTRYGGAVQTHDALPVNYTGGVARPVALSNLSVPGGAGGMVSTPADMAFFIRDLFKLKLIGQPLLTAMTPLSGSLGRGLVQVPVADELAFGHFGIIDGFKSTLLYLPQTDLALAVCFNSANTDDNAAVEKILTISLQQLSHNVTLPAAQLARYAGVYTSRQLPIKITIKATNGRLTMQADKREPLVLETLSATSFRFSKGDMMFNFSVLPGNAVNHFSLKQGTNIYEFYR